MVNIIYKDEYLVIVNKAAGIPSQQDKSGDKDAISLCAELLASNGENSELHIINRLDRVVGGLILLARSSKCSAELSCLIESDISKEYYAVVEGDPGEGIMEDYLCKDAILGKAYVVKTGTKGAKTARLEYKTLATKEQQGKIVSLVKIKLLTGRFHQIRVQFSSRKMPILGDKKYGSKDFRAKMPSLFAARLKFEYKSHLIEAKALPNLDLYPWSLFTTDSF